MKQKEYFMLFVFALFLISFAIFSRNIDFHDAVEYITIAKKFAGIENVDIFSAHSLVYPLVISIFLRISRSLSMIKIVNTFWLFLIGATFLLWLKNKKAFILFAFSPLTWYTSIQIVPVLPASFFFLLSFIFFKKKDIKFNFFYSGLFLGFACALYTPMLLVSLAFILVYFWQKNFSEVIKYFPALIIGFVPGMILDYYLFSMPFYSLIRYAGANFIVSLGMNPSGTFFDFGIMSKTLLILVLISPFLFKLYKLNFQPYKKEIIFSILVVFIILLGAPLLKYFLIITPIIILLLAKILNEKEIKWHCIISIFLIIIMTWDFFIIEPDTLIQRDLEKITSEFDVDYIIAGPSEAPLFATFLWQNEPRIAWFQDFQASIENKTRIRGYDFTTQSKIPLKSRLTISASFNRFSNKTYENYILVSRKESNIEGFDLKKCYKILCVYE